LEPQQNNVEDRPAELYVPMGYVVASLVGVAPRLNTVGLVAKAIVKLAELQTRPPLLVAAATLTASSAPPLSTGFLNIATIRGVRVMGTTRTMLSSLLHDLLVALAQVVMLIHVKG
jgi:hypothetical protein